jgi:hypothetical protein
MRNQILTGVFVLLNSIYAFAFNGVYSVPIDNIAAKNKISGVELVNLGSGTELRYMLPEDLVGPDPFHISLTLDHVIPGKSGPQYIFKYGQAKAVCQGQDSSSTADLTCRIEYKWLSIDSQKRDQFLNQKYAQDPSFLAEKLHVAALFGSDPIGILQIFCGQLNCGL